MENILAIFEPSLANPAGKRAYGFFIPWRKVGRQKALHDRAVDEEMPLGARPLIPRLPACVGRGAAYCNARTEVDVTENSVVDAPRCVVEERIDAFRSIPSEGVIQARLGLVIDRTIVPKFLHTLPNFLGSAGEADRPTSLDLRNLPNR